MTNTIIWVLCEDNTILTEEIVYMVLFIQLWKKPKLSISLRTLDQSITQIAQKQKKSDHVTGG